MSGPIGKALITHVDSVFTGPNGDDAAVMKALEGVSIRLQDAHLRLKAVLDRVTDADLLKPQPAEQNRTLLELILSSGPAHEAHHGGQIDYLKGLQTG